MNASLLEERLAEVLPRPPAVHVFERVASTNTEGLRLLDQALAASRSLAAVVCAKEQTAGRGRRGRPWLSAGAGSVCMSLAKTLPRPAGGLLGLSLVTALATLRVLRRFGAADLFVKWPNDVLHGRRKLAGVLLETRGAASGGRSGIVFGIGINLRLSPALRRAIDQPAADLAAAVPVLPAAEDVVAQLAACHQALLDRYLDGGFAPFVGEWNDNDRHFGRDIVVARDGERRLGKSLGVDGNGALQVLTAEGRETVVSGEIFPDTAAGAAGSGGSGDDRRD